MRVSAGACNNSWHDALNLPPAGATNRLFLFPTHPLDSKELAHEVSRLSRNEPGHGR